MIVPLNWLKEYIDIRETSEELAKIFTSIGYMLDRPISYTDTDVILDLEVRQNRADCLSLVGLAQELSAVLNRPLMFPACMEHLPATTSSTTIDIDDPHACPRFFALTYENVQIQESPEWMKKRLEAYGIKSINSVVDITNYVSVELGMPMHAYDADLVKNRHITIRNAREGEEIELFGGRHVACSSDDIIHADDDGPIGLGALMGGEAKSVHDTSTAIILEAAVYDQASVRRSSRRHNIRTDASTRLEKFIHPQLVEVAITRAAQLMADIHGSAHIVATTDIYPRPQSIQSISCSSDAVRRLIGIDVSQDAMIKILHALQCTTTVHDSDVFEVTPPFFRTDLEQEADIAEEIVRIYGYDAIPEKLPQQAPPRSLQSSWYDKEELARDACIAMGYDEVITEPLTHEETSTLTPIHLENSLTSEKDMLRTTLQHSLYRALSERTKHRQQDIRLFEVGKIYFLEADSYKEERVIGLATKGEHTFLQLKGDCEELCRRLGYAYSADIVTYVALDDASYFACISLEKLVHTGVSYSPRILSSVPQVIIHDFVCVIRNESRLEDVLGHISSIHEHIYRTQYVSTQTADSGQQEHVIRVYYAHPDGHPLTTTDVREAQEAIQTYLSTV